VFRREASFIDCMYSLCCVDRLGLSELLYAMEPQAGRVVNMACAKGFLRWLNDAIPL
jgi:hypothetical protein